MAVIVIVATAVAGATGVTTIATAIHVHRAAGETTGSDLLLHHHGDNGTTVTGLKTKTTTIGVTFRRVEIRDRCRIEKKANSNLLLRHDDNATTMVVPMIEANAAVIAVMLHRAHSQAKAGPRFVGAP